MFVILKIDSKFDSYGEIYHMSLYQKSLFILALFIPILSLSSEQQIFQLLRVKYPDEKSIAVERAKSDARILKKYVITTTVVVSAVVALYLLYQIREAAAQHEKDVAKDENIMKNLMKEFQEKYDITLKASTVSATSASVITSGIAPSKPSQSWMSQALNSTKSFGLNAAKFFADSAFLLASGAVLNGFYNYTCQKMAQIYVDETVLWYAHEQTKIPHLFHDLKTYATDYDLFATLLSVELFNQEAQIHFKDFIKNLIGAAKDYMHNDVFNDPAYFQYLLEEMKKKYIKKGQEIDKVSEHVVAAVAKHNRAVAQEHASVLFANDMNRRADMAKMCDIFVNEMELLTSFIALRGGLHQQARIYDMIDASNRFLDHMQMLLNCTPEQLQAYSLADCGMFTSLYEYEKLFSEQINFLHRYCRLMN